MAQETPRQVPLAAVVLAGGASRRMGRDKATLPLPPSVPSPLRPDGTGPAGEPTMVEHMVAVVGERCRPVIVVAAPGQALPALPAQIVRDEVRGVGPLLATGRGLRAAADAGAELAFVCAVDMPFLTVDVIDALVGPAARLGVDVALPWSGRDHYLAAVYRTGLADRVDALVTSGARAMRALVHSVDAQRIVLADPQPLSNLNSAADLQALQPTH